MIKPAHLLILRFSSLGDVAMTVPVIRLLLQQHPQLTVTVVSSAFMAPLFEGTERLVFHPAALKGKHRGVAGLWRLYKELTAMQGYTALADLHNVLRTQILRRFFTFSATAVAVINKGRKEKKELTRLRYKKLRPLKSTFQRYADVFAALGYPVLLQGAGSLLPAPSQPEVVKLARQQGQRLIGIAPIAQYAEKTYPPEQMKAVVERLAGRGDCAIFLLGGKAEQPLFTQWEAAFPAVTSLAGRGLAAELAVIAHLDLVVSMDSANMHLASLYGVPVVSVWGGTHPYLGFMGWKQSLQNAVQIDLPCRPSSVFGNKACPNRGACLNGISPEMIYQKISVLLQTIKRENSADPA